VRVVLFALVVLALIFAFCERATVRAEGLRVKRVMLEGDVSKQGRLCPATAECLPEAKKEHPFIESNTRWQRYWLK
jgi:fido (protein-threonine AMPylation protein)